MRARHLLLLSLSAPLLLSACAQAAPAAPGASPSVSSSAAQAAVPQSPAPQALSDLAATSLAPSPSPTEPAAVPVNKAHFNLPARGSHPGVGVPVLVTFKHPVRSDAARQAIADRTLVTADGEPVAGGWWWASAREAHWRPLEYWPGSADVLFTLDMDGLDLGKYRGAAKPLTTEFTTAPAYTAWVNGRTQQMRVYKNGKRVRTIPVSTGMSGHDTRNGTKLIISRQRDYTMRGGEGADQYEVFTKYAMRITWSGEFIHSAPWATYRLGRFPGSHGCTNISTGDSQWVYDTLPLYTPVKYTRMKGEDTAALNGLGDWNVPNSDLIVPQAAAEAAPSAPLAQ